MARRCPSLSVATILVLGALVLAACGGGGEGVQTSAAGESAAGPASSNPPGTNGRTATTQAEAPVLPLLGLPAPDATAADRAAVVVKIDNDPHARPQSGLDHADLVYEIEVEGITRFAAVFQSEDVDTIGPIRSARSSDIDLISNLHRPLFAWSGANPTVQGEVGGAAAAGRLVNVNHDAAPDLYWRDTSRIAPYNLYSDTAQLRALAPSDQAGPDAVFTYLDEGEGLPDGAIPVAGISVTYPGDGRISNVEFVWDAERRGWARFQTDLQHPDGANAHRVADGEIIAPTNVVVLSTDYTVSAAGGGSPQALSVGSGDAIVLVDGQAVTGRWTRASAEEPYSLETATGDPIDLAPGRTWVLLPEPGRTAYLPADRAAALLLQ